MTDLFDLDLRAQRRDRAARQGPETFLFDRALADIAERLALIPRRFERALLVGALGNPKPLQTMVARLDVRDPSPLLATAAGGEAVAEEHWPFEPGSFDLLVSVGTLDTLNALPAVMQAMRLTLQPDGLLIGAVSGGDTLPQLRAAMRAADAVSGEAQAHIHPRIEAAALAPLLGSAGFVRPVVDVDRVRVAYSGLPSLVRDLRAMAATNILLQRPRRGLSRTAMAAAIAAFADLGENGRTTEVFELLHFAAWTPSESARSAGR